MRLHIPHMSCGRCAGGVTRAIEAVDAEARITLDQVSRKVEVSTDLPRRQIATALAAAGHAATPTAA